MCSWPMKARPGFRLCRRKKAAKQAVAAITAGGTLWAVAGREPRALGLRAKLRRATM